MATRTANLAATNNTDVNFRAWINEIHNALIAYGWVQTADTGQINFATVTRPAGANTYQGYAVYRMNDALQSTCAVFMRIDFGTAGGVDSPGIKVQITIGGTNGAGTLTGNVSSIQTTAASNSGTATTANCRTSGTASRFCLSFWHNDLGAGTTGQGFLFIVERDRDTAGNETSLGVNFLVFYVTGTSSGNWQGRSQFLELAGGTGAVDTIFYAMVSAQSSQSGGGNVGVGPVRTQLGPFRNPMMGLLLCVRSDFTMATTGPVTIYGTSHTYIFLATAQTNNNAINQWNANCAFAMLWE